MCVSVNVWLCVRARVCECWSLAGGVPQCVCVSVCVNVWLRVCAHAFANVGRLQVEFRNVCVRECV